MISNPKTTLKNKKPGFEPGIADFLIYSTVSVILSIRNLFHNPDAILNELEIKPGMKILDFGCGPGHFAVSAAKKTQGDGRVFALDYNPLAFEKLDKKNSKKRNQKYTKNIL